MLADKAFKVVSLARLEARAARIEGSEESLWEARVMRVRWEQIHEFARAGYLSPEGIAAAEIWADAILAAEED